MIKTHFIPIAAGYDHNNVFMMKARGEWQAEIDKVVAQREAAETELNMLLEDGYEVLHSGHLTATPQTSIVFVLYKPDLQFEIDETLKSRSYAD